jgi:hypothetical protein
MEFTDVQALLAVMLVLTAVALLVFIDFRKKRRGQQLQRVQTRKAARPERSITLFDAAPRDYSLPRKVAVERPVEPVAATPTVSKPPTAPPAIARETVTIQMTAPAGPPGGPMTGDQMNGTELNGAKLNGQEDGTSSKLAISLPAFALPAFTIDAALWERLLASTPKHALLGSGGAESNPEPALEKPAAMDVAPGALDANYQVIHSEPQSAWPKGMIQQAAFQKLLDGGEPFSGLVVSIGVNEGDSSMWHGQGLMQSIGTYIGGLLRDTDFSCRTAYDEFIVVCCGEEGAQSQRRLNHISERLWDYQLRGINTCSILFSWGGVEVQDEPLAESVASAVDRMRQTKRAGSPSGSGNAHRLAV